MLKKLLLSLTLILISFSTKAWIIYFYEQGNGWSDIKIHLNNAEEGILLTETERDVYKYSGTEEVSTLKFTSSTALNNVNKTTGIYNFESGQVYGYNGSVSNIFHWYLTINNEPVLHELVKDGNTSNYTGSFKVNSESVDLYLHLDGPGSRIADKYYVELQSDFSSDFSGINFVSDPSGSYEGQTLSGFIPGNEYTFVWDTFKESMSVEGVFESGEKETVIYFTGASRAFSNTQNPLTFESLFYAEDPELKATDIKAELIPQFPIITAETGSEKLTEEQLLEMSELTESHYNIDGFYKDPEGEISIRKTQAGDFNVTIPAFSCSGLYELVLTSATPETKPLAETHIPITIYPNLYNIFGTIEKPDGSSCNRGLSINQIAFERGDNNTSTSSDYIIMYPFIYEEENGYNLWGYEYLDNSVIQTPGLYLTGEDDEMHVRVDLKEENAFTSYPRETRRAVPSSDYTKYEDSFDLSGIGTAESNRNADIYIYVKKNGAEIPTMAIDDSKTVQPFSLVIDPSSVETYIEKLEAESGIPQYFNLQGIKLENPKRGIVIKKEGNKASKIFIR